MITRTYVTKSGDTYEWVETEETIDALKKLHEIVKQNENPIESKPANVG